MTTVSTHVLDTEHGRPAVGVRVELYDGDALAGEGATNDDGRIPELAAGLAAGVYRLVFHPPSPFFRHVDLALALDDGHYHVPLLLSRYSCTTYRGS